MSRSMLAALALSFAALPNAHALVDTLEATCHSAYVADDGYNVNVIQSDTGQITAHLSKISLHGSFPIASLRVEKLENPSSQIRQYIGKGIELELNLLDLTQSGWVKAKLSGSALPIEQFTDLICDVTEKSIPQLPVTEPQPICMAYFEGARFNTATGECVMTGASGCSNPFEFLTVENCEKAYAIRWFK